MASAASASSRIAFNALPRRERASHVTVISAMHQDKQHGVVAVGACSVFAPEIEPMAAAGQLLRREPHDALHDDGEREGLTMAK